MTSILMENQQKPTMHCQNELEADLKYSKFVPDEVLHKWFNDDYSTSKHLLTLYSIVRGLKARTILEIGFGRSSFVLARAAAENQGKFFSCDVRDFSYLLNEDEKKVTEFVHGKSDEVWSLLSGGIDFAFLDYFSDEQIPESFVKTEILQALSHLKENGVIAIHDGLVEKYSLRATLKKIGKKGFFGSKIGIETMVLPYNYGLALIRKTESTSFGFVADHYNNKKDC